MGIVKLREGLLTALHITSTTAPHTTDTFVSCEGFLVLLSCRQNIIKLGGKKEIQTSNSFVASG